MEHLFSQYALPPTIIPIPANGSTTSSPYKLHAPTPILPAHDQKRTVDGSSYLQYGPLGNLTGLTDIATVGFNLPSGTQNLSNELDKQDRNGFAFPLTPPTTSTSFPRLDPITLSTSAVTEVIQILSSPDNQMAPGTHPRGPVTNHGRPAGPYKPDEYCTLRGYNLFNPVLVDRRNLVTLEPTNWLNTTIVNFSLIEVYNHYLETSRNLGRTIALLPADCWQFWHATNGLRAYRSDPEYIRNPVDADLMVFPINVVMHWMLVIVVDARALLDPTPEAALAGASIPVRLDREPVVLVFDSLQEQFHNEGMVRGLIKELGGGRVNASKLDKITFIRPQFPAQTNNFDCGLYPSHILSIFLKRIDRAVGVAEGTDSCTDFWETSKIDGVRAQILRTLETLHVVWTQSLRWEAFFPVENAEKKTKGTVLMF